MVHNDKTMMIDDKTRKKLIRILKGTEYRKVVSERADCHPSTVSNLLRVAPNVTTEKSERVELELLVFAKEVLEKREASEKRKKARRITKQLYQLTKS